MGTGAGPGYGNFEHAGLRHGGGDRDYNDLVFGLDFTSASRRGWLV
jgi:hypothetical protein